MPHCSIVAFVASVGLITTDASLLISWKFGYPSVKRPTMSIRSYFMIKQCDLPELETVVSYSVAGAWQVARALVNRRYLKLSKKNGHTALLNSSLPARR